MATKQQPEVIRQLDDEGLSVAWDTDDVSEELRDAFMDAAQGEVDILFRTIDEDGEPVMVAVEAKTTRDKAA